jgi:16S rRNA (adenine1518-N6/adenine1519-N6)-dimethyltransferase
MQLTPTKLKELCIKYGLTPSKNYGQNYLITDAPIKKMIATAKLSKDDTVVEIGPGFGVLTFALAERVGRVISLEIEKKIEDYWKEILNDKRYEIRDKIEIKWGNALKNISPISCLLSNYKVIANIPYQITSDLLRTLLELENKPESITLMVQKEVAERICAKPGEMNLLAASVQYYGEPKVIDVVSKGCFWPSPKVDSAILHIRLKDSKIERFKDYDFFKFVKAGFSHKRKQLWSNLSRGLKIDQEKVKSVLIDVVGSEKIRAEEVGVEEWKEIVERLNNF